MANSLYVNKVEYGNQTIIDLTGDTVTAADVRQGVSFHLPSGASSIGTAVNGYTIYMTTTSPEFYGQTITVSQNGSVIGTTSFDNQGNAQYSVDNVGTYTVSVTASGTTVSEEVVVSQIEIELEAGFQYKRWLGLTDLDPDDYSSLADVLSDEEAVRQLMTRHASVDYLASFTADDTSVVTILNNDLAAKWITCTAYAEDVLTDAYGTLMASIGKYGYGKWVEINNVWQPLGNVPIMTSNTAPYGEASATSYYSNGYEPYKAFRGAFDGTGGQGNSWQSGNGQVTNQRLVYKFVTPVCVHAVDIMNTPWSNEAVKTFKVQGSNDGSTWEDITPSALTNDVTASKRSRHTFANDKYYLYIGLMCLTNNGSTSVISINGVQFYGRQMTVSVPKMDTNATPYGEASASDTYDNTGTYAAYKAFDRNVSDYWHSNGTRGTKWIRYKFESPTIIHEMYLYSENPNRLENFVVRGSDDAVTWKELTEAQTPASSTPGSVQCIFTKNIGAYQYYEVYVPSGASVNIDILQFFGFDYSEKEWDTAYPRHYIYDNGVELETIATSGTVTKNPNCLTLASQNAQASVTLDTTSYNLLRAFVGAHASGTNTLICGAGTATFIAANMPYAQGLDVSNVNGDSATGVKQTSAGVFDCEAVWLE